MKLNVLITITYTSDTPLTYYEIMIMFARPLSVTPNAGVTGSEKCLRDY